jgi:sugar diacid utilization regulator
MVSQLTAEHPSAPEALRTLVPAPDDATLLRHAVSTSAALRRAEGPAHVLDMLTAAARLVAPTAAVWALRRVGGPASRATASATAFETTSAFGAAAAACSVDPAAVLDELGEQILVSQSPFDVELFGGPLAAALETLPVPFALTAFPLDSTDASGALLVAAPESALTSAQRSVLALLCDEAAGALALETARATAEQAEALFQTLTQLSASFSERDLVLQQIVRCTADLMRTDAAWIMLADEAKQMLTMTTAYGITSTSFFDATCGTDELLPGAAIRKRRVVCIGDLRGDEHAKRTQEEGLRSIFCAPMFVQDELLGVLIAANRETRDLSPEDRRIMDALASGAAVSIGNARLYAERERSIKRLASVNALLEARSEFQQRLTELVLAGAELDELVAAATDALGCRVLVLDRDLAVLHASPEADTAVDVAGLREAIRSSDQISDGSGVFRVDLAREGRRSSEVLVAPLDLGGQRTAFVVVASGEQPATGPGLAMTEAAVTAIGLELMRERATAEAEARLTGGLFQTLLAGDGTDDASILRRSSYLGYELSGENVVIAATALDESGSGSSRAALGLQNVVQRAVRRHWDAPAPVFERDDAVFVVLSDPQEVTPALIKEQCRLVRQAIELSGRSSGIRIAYAGPHRGIAGVRRAVSEAAYALQVQDVIGKAGAPVAFSELGVWTLLGRVGSREHLVSFAESVLGELLVHDAQRHAQLVDTLRTLIKCNFHYRTAAEALYAHPNTIRYRMTRISALTGLDLTDGDDRLKVELALRILDVVGIPRAPASAA